MITSIKIKNLRSLKDTNFVEIKPITILVGANSSGKSTFLRSFLLLTQSVVKSLRGSISWFDDSYVDFGDYTTAKCQFASDEECIEFHYKIDELHMLTYRKHGIYSTSSYGMTPSIIKPLLQSINVSLSFIDDVRGTFINGITIETNGISVEFGVTKRETKAWVKINGQELSLKSEFVFHFSAIREILPWLISPPYSDNLEFFDSLKEEIQKFVVERSDKKTKKLERANFVFDLWECDKLSFLNRLINDTRLQSFNKYIRKWDTKNSEFTQLYNYLTLYHILLIYPSIDKEIAGMYCSCSYIAPVRAGASRYYRTQGLQINDIDAYGRNLPEFIASLSNTALKSYNDYTMSLFNVKVKKENSPGHQSLVLETDKGKYNMADVGFGYSQILPIITKLWFYQYSSSKNFDYWRIIGQRRLVTMEQPELHLHPAYQAKIADAFIASVFAKNEDGTIKNDTPRIIIETHSEAIINRIGRRIREGALPADYVNVVLFEKSVDDKETHVVQTKYDKKGQLENWPIGFFDPID